MTIQNFIDFFQYDLKIKNMITKATPKFTDGFSKNYIMKYSDKLFETINDCRYYFNKITSQFTFLELYKETMTNLFKEMEDELSDCGYDFRKLKIFYEKRFSQMRESFVTEVGTHCIGYLIFFNPPIQNAISLNELLHVVHQSIINNDDYYRALPVIKEKTTSLNNEITLRGVNSSLADEIFKTLPDQVDIGSYIEILSMNEENALMMVRDRGHALSIEIKKEENNFYYIHYFLPKICNVDMVNNLPGVSKVNDQSKFTSGTFRTTKENLSKDLVTFILNVPTDLDMDFHFPTK